MKMDRPLLLGIETSCDETAAAILSGETVVANVISSQLAHAKYGGVIPELASRLHQQHIVRVVEAALTQAQVTSAQLNAVAVTQGPGLLGALLVGTCFAKSYAWGLDIPLIGVNHMEAHVLANFLQQPHPRFPFLCLTVSGGHTQIVRINDYLDMELMGQTIDDAAGEAFDKAAKLMELPYPGGPHIDRLAQTGDGDRFDFPTPEVAPFDFSFSGLKTALFYLLKAQMAEDQNFIQNNLADICASYQKKIVSILLSKLSLAAQEMNIQHLAIAGGVSANTELRARFQALCVEQGWQAYIPEFEYCTDNAAMIGIAGHYKYLAGQYANNYLTPFTR